MPSRTLNAKDLQLLLRTARELERSLPDQVRRAYIELLPPLGDRFGEEPLEVSRRERAQRVLVERGLLTPVELATLPADAAIDVAVGRVREQIAALEAERAAHATSGQSSGKAPRTLRR